MSPRFIVCFFFLLLALDAYAQVDAEIDTTVALPEIQISADRYRPGAAHTPAQINHIPRDQVTATGARSLTEVLERAGNVHLRRYGTGLSTLSVRGSAGSQSLVLIDGIPLGDPQLGQVDLSLIPSVLLESVSVMHGQGSSLYGANGIGGVVSLTSRSYLHESTTGSLKGLIGPFGERTVEASLGAGNNRFNGFAAVQYGTEKGDFPYLDPSLFPATTVRRQGADRTYFTLFGKLDRLSKTTHTSLNVWVTQFERGVPGSIAFPPRDERQWDDLTRLSVQHIIAVPRGTFLIRSSSHQSSLRYSNPFLQIDDTGRTSSITSEAVYTVAMSPKVKTIIGLDAAFRKARHPALSADAREWQGSLYAQGDLLYKSLRIFPSFRFDNYVFPGEDRVASFSPALGLNLRIPFLPLLHIKGQAGRSFRSPTFNDRFWQPGGNPHIRPETAWSYEGGLWMGSEAGDNRVHMNSEVTVYHYRIRDQITWQPTEEGFWAPFNIEGVRTRGVETSLSMELNANRRSQMRSKILYTIADSRNRSNPGSSTYDQPLRYTPRHTFKIILGASRTVDRTRLGVDLFLRHTGKQFVTTDGLSSIPSFWTGEVRFSGSRMMKDYRLSLDLLIENLFDESYALIKGFPMPPRLLRVQLGIHLPR